MHQNNGSSTRAYSTRHPTKTLSSTPELSDSVPASSLRNTDCVAPIDSHDNAPKFGEVQLSLGLISGKFKYHPRISKRPALEMKATSALQVTDLPGKRRNHVNGHVARGPLGMEFVSSTDTQTQLAHRIT